MINYNNGKIYKIEPIVEHEEHEIYIGSTTDFTRRKNSHKNNCNNEKRKDYNAKKYQYIRVNGGWNEWNMVEIEKFIYE